MYLYIYVHIRLDVSPSVREVNHKCPARWKGGSREAREQRCEETAALTSSQPAHSPLPSDIVVLLPTEALLLPGGTLCCLH